MFRHRAVVDAVRDAIFVADIETGMIVDANPAAEALCGRSLAELQSLHHTQLYPPEVAERARVSFDRRTRLPGLTEGHVLHKDGHRIPVEISASHFTTSDGRRMLVKLSPQQREGHSFVFRGLAIPSGAPIIQLREATYLPGLIDVHVHFTGDPTRQGFQALGISVPRSTRQGVRLARQTVLADGNLGLDAFARWIDVNSHKMTMAHDEIRDDSTRACCCYQQID